MHILIADDTKDNLDPVEVYFRCVSTHGHIVEFATSGEDALLKYSAARQNGAPFDAVVLDIAMPDISGLLVAKHIRAAGDDVPIVFFTAYDRAPNRHGAEDVQAADYLVKPIEPQELEEAIERVINHA